jgi:tyrosyl-tRNA synthetase
MFDLKKELISGGVTVSDLCAVHTQIFPSKGELRRLIEGGGLSINRIKVESGDLTIGADILLNGKYILVQKGKKNYFLIRAV